MIDIKDNLNLVTDGSIAERDADGNTMFTVNGPVSNELIEAFRKLLDNYSYTTQTVIKTTVPFEIYDSLLGD